LPGKKALIGSCGGELAGAVDYFASGCMPLANSPHAILHSMTGTFCSVLSVRNKNLLSVLAATVKIRRIRSRLIGQGERLDVPFQLGAGIVEPRPLTEAEKDVDWIAWPQSPIIDRREKKKLRDFEDDAAIASLRGVLVSRLKDKFLWRAQAAAGLAVTAAPLVLAALGAAGIGTWWSPATWLLVFGIIEAIHIAELPFSLRAHARREERLKATTGRRSAWRTILATLTIGYPAWVPYAKGVFD
jgi:hypothetical protein